MSVLYQRNDLQSDCGIYKSLIFTEGSNVDDYIRQLSQFLKDRSDMLNKSLDNVQSSEWIGIPDELAEKVGHFFTNNTNKTIYNALFVMTNSFLEWAMIELCRIAALYLNEDFLNYNVREQGIKKAKTFLKDKLTIVIPGNAEWQLFTDNQTVRNLIVHNGSNIIKDYSKGVDQQPDVDIFKRNKQHLEYTETGYIYILTIEYISNTHNTAKIFIQEQLKLVIDELRKRGIYWA